MLVPLVKKVVGSNDLTGIVVGVTAGESALYRGSNPDRLHEEEGGTTCRTIRLQRK